MWPFKKKPPPDPENESRRQMDRADHAVEESVRALEASKETREDVVALIAALRGHRKANSWNEEIEKIMGTR